MIYLGVRRSNLPNIGSERRAFSVYEAPTISTLRISVVSSRGIVTVFVAASMTHGPDVPSTSILSIANLTVG